jgi:hypothetical protein
MLDEYLEISLQQSIFNMNTLLNISIMSIVVYFKLSDETNENKFFLKSVQSYKYDHYLCVTFHFRGLFLWKLNSIGYMQG